MGLGPHFCHCVGGGGGLWKNPRHPVSENPVNLDDDTIVS